MSPEQARGQSVDRRTDIWAFGCVLFEMLTGSELFGGDTRSDTIAAILDREPAWDRLPAATPPSIRRLLRRCLEKDTRRRLHDIADARLDLDDARVLPARGADSPERTRFRRFAPWAAVIVCAAVTASVSRSSFRGAPAPEAAPIRFTVDPQGTLPRSGVPSLSPDGRRLTFAAPHEGAARVWIRSLDSAAAEPVDGSGAGYTIFWSPDSRSLAFYGREGLQILDDMGHIRTLGVVPGAGYYGAMWCPDGRIVLGSLSQGLFALSANGDSPLKQLTTFDTEHGEGGQLFPTMLPDGRHFLDLSVPSSTIWVAALDSKDATRLLNADSQAVFVPPGYLLFVRRQRLFAQRFDPERLKIAGEPVSIAEGVFTEQYYGADFTASSNGELAYRTGTLHARTQLAWYDRTGKRLGTVGPSGRYPNIELSSDGARVVMEVLDAQAYTKDIWTMDTAHGVLTRLTFDPGNETFPIWSPDARWIMFGSDRDGGWQLYKRRTDGVGGDERVATTAESMVPQNWAPDGQSVVYLQRPANLGLLSLTNPPTVRLIDPARNGGLGRPDGLDGYGQVSPDGHWLLYSSNESGRYEVYVQRFPDRERAKWKISERGAISPR